MGHFYSYFYMKSFHDVEEFQNFFLIWFFYAIIYYRNYVNYNLLLVIMTM